MSLNLSKKKVKEGWGEVFSPTKPLGNDAEAIEKIIYYANKMYPKGTRYLCVLTENECEVGGTFSYTNSSAPRRKIENFITDGCGGFVFLEGKWAEKIE